LEYDFVRSAELEFWFFGWGKSPTIYGKDRIAQTDTGLLCDAALHKVLHKPSITVAIGESAQLSAD
jgi:hypothetical protein